MARWLVQAPGAAPVGPVDAAELRRAWTRRAIKPGTLVCAEGFAAWVPFDTVGELVGPVLTPPSRVQPSPPSGTPNPVRSPTNPRLMRKIIFGASSTLALTVVVAALVVTVRSDAYKLAMMSPAEAADFGFALYDTMTAPDEKRAIPFFERSCKAGEPKGCTGLGTANFDGSGGLSKNYERAVELLDPACEKGVLRACRKVANCYAFGWGTPKDVKRARELWARACDGGEARACHHLGTLYAASDAPPELHDPKLGLAMFRKACDGGFKDGCDRARVVEAAEADKAAAQVKKERWKTMWVGLSKKIREQAGWDMGRGTVTPVIDVITREVGEPPSAKYEGSYGAVITYVWGPPLGKDVTDSVTRAAPFSAEMLRGMTCGDYTESSVNFYSYGERSR